MIRRVQQKFERFENPLIIIDHGNHGAAPVIGRGHSGILTD